MRTCGVVTQGIYDMEIFYSSLQQNARGMGKTLVAIPCYYFLILFTDYRPIKANIIYVFHK